MSLQRHLRVVDSRTEDGFVDTAVKVAFATSDMKGVDQHFGAAECFVIYAVDQDKAQVLGAAQFGQLAMDGNEDKLAAKIDALDGCIAVYANAVGASAIGQLKAKGIQPVKVSPGAPIEELIVSLQEELRLGPGAWLARALEQHKPKSPERFDDMLSEGWEE
jgi:nitrogen fixation protein NifX